MIDSVRPFVSEDAAAVARLHQRVYRPFARGGDSTCTAYEAYLQGVLLNSPVSDPMLPSLVCEDRRGLIVGFVGVASRTLVSRGRRTRAAVSCQFMVDPDGPAGLIAVRLARAFLSGPQDLSISDGANDAARAMWERLGGTTDQLLSLHWTRPLRPARLALSLLGQRRSTRPLVAALAPVAGAVDGVAARARFSHLRQTPPTATAIHSETSAMLEHEDALADGSTLHVAHDERTFAWLLTRAQRAGGRGPWRTVVARGGTLAGWYVWTLNPLGVADLLQIAATRESIGDVLDHLFFSAWSAGASAVTGRAEPPFLQALSDKYCLFHRRGPWTLIHARCPELLQPFWTGRASFPRLDGEWSLAF
jgi:hypothetical protein